MSSRQHPNFSDPAFVARLRAADPDALSDVVHAYVDQILRAARGAGLNAERAEDVPQETFATFIQTVGRFEGRSHVRPWLFGILYNKISEERRSAQREARADDIDETVEARFDTRGAWMNPPRRADRDLDDEEIRELIERCLEPVSPRQRLAFVLREVEGHTTEEICNAMDVTATNLGVLMYRVKNRLRECLEKWGVVR